MIDIDRPDWRRDGACNTGTAEFVPLFFPERGQPTKPAKDICAQCDIVDACREYALMTLNTKGVWGGLSENERRNERARRRAAGVWELPPKPIEHGTDVHNAYRCDKRPERACALCVDARSRFLNPDPKPQTGYDDVYRTPRKRLADIDGAA